MLRLLALGTLPMLILAGSALAQVQRAPLPGQGPVPAPLPGTASRPPAVPSGTVTPAPLPGPPPLAGPPGYVPPPGLPADPIASGARPPASGTVTGGGPVDPNAAAAATTGIPIGDLEQRQDAWKRPRPSAGQTMEGVREVVWDGRPIRVVARERMTTAILLPPGEKVVAYILGDTTVYRAIGPRGAGGDAQLPENTVAVRPIYPGADTNLVVFAESGKQYLFYVESHPYDFREITDLLVRVLAPPVDSASSVIPAALSSSVSQTSQLGVDGQQADGSTIDRNLPDASENAPPGESDPALQARHGPIYRDLAIQVQNYEDARIAPLLVYRNRHFTVMEFGHRYDEIDLPTVARVTPEGYEQQVQFRWSGSRLIVSGVGEFVLRQGQYLVCIKRRPGPALAAGQAPVAQPGDIR